MVNPLTNDKIPSASSQHRPNTEQKSVNQSQGQSTAVGDPVAAKKKGVDNTLELSGNGRILSQTADRIRGSEGEVRTPEEAAALTARIREQFEQSGTQSLAIHRDIRADQLTNLLNSAPA